MITVKSKKKFRQYLDELSYKFTVEQMQRDCLDANSENSEDKQNIRKFILMSFSNHKVSIIPHRFLLRYQFKKIASWIGNRSRFGWNTYYRSKAKSNLE
jgi:hypothetical protein